MHARERLLQQILGSVRGLVPQEAEDGPRVPAVQRFERANVAPPVSGYQVVVAGLLRLHFERMNEAGGSFIAGYRPFVTSGASPNVYRFAIRGVGGPSVYHVDFDWTFQTREDVVWRLPWSKVATAQKSGAQR